MLDVHGALSCSQKMLYGSMALPQAPVHLPQVSRKSHLSYNRGDEMKPKAVRRSPGIYLKAEENTGKC